MEPRHSRLCAGSNRLKPALEVLDINLPGVGGLDIARARLIGGWISLSCF